MRPFPSALRSLFSRKNVPFLWTPTKDILVCVSITLFFFLSIILLHDFSQLELFQNAEKTTQRFAMSVLMFHTIGFFFGITSYVYITQAQNESKAKLGCAIFATVGNFILFALRVLLDIMYRNFREEYYRL